MSRGIFVASTEGEVEWSEECTGTQLKWGLANIKYTACEGKGRVGEGRDIWPGGHT